MVSIVKDGDKVDKYWVTEELERATFFIRYSAGLDDGSGNFELRQYKSPVPTVDWFNSFVAHQGRLMEKVSSDPELQKVCEEATEILGNVEVDGKVHSELFKVISPAPTRLSEFLEAYELAGIDRFLLANSIARALAVVHKSELILVGFSPSSIGIREDGSPIFLDLDWTRVSGEQAPWDGYQGDVSYAGFDAPELGDGGKPTMATDVYSLACLLVELLVEKQSTAHEEGKGLEFAQPFIFRRELPDFDHDSVTAILQACLSKDPTARPSAEIVAVALANCTNDPGKVPPVFSVVPRWLQQSLQTLAFWVAYQNEVYRHHDLPEGAIVAELTRLIYATVDSNMMVLREPQYSSLQHEGNDDWFGASRADLAIRSRTPRSLAPSCDALIEVKRGNAAAQLVHQDIAKLAKFRTRNPQSRTFLVVVSQASVPWRWVGDNGVANPETQSLSITLDTGEVSDVRYRVRRVVKAAASFKAIEKATYCCLIEVI